MSQLFRSLAFALLGVLAFGLLAVGCSEDPSPIITEDDPPTATGGFAITGLKEDSLYWGEWGTLNGTDFGEDTSATQLMLLFDRVQHSLVTTKTIFFKVPSGGQSAKLRLFKGDSAAVGNVRLTVLPMPYGGFKPKANTFSPSTAKEGDLIVIYGSSMPLRGRDYSIWLGPIPLSVDSFSSTKVFTHVPAHAKSGKLAVTLLGSVYECGLLTITQ